MKKVVWFSLLLLLLSGCATKPSVDIQGKTLANGTLVNDTVNMLSLYSSAMGCDSIENITSKVVNEPSGEIGNMSWREQWDVTGCGQTSLYSILYQEDGAGGTFFSVSKDS
ncbi:hypothetical protein ACFSJ3_03905 [Corallincola platygyrae]|uniref:Lipoprotein n=1 Tax=Corallincola platygyrae TaxID=1193278 RepID=A0ABW4XHU7_9GAMM